MSLQVRRVVTGHDEHGRAIVVIDEMTTNVQSSRPGASASVIWTTETIPADNSGHDDGAARTVGTTLAGGTVFRVIEYMPGVAPRMHRTDSIDYAVVISGEIDMQLDAQRSASARRRRGCAARDDPQLGQSRRQTLCHCFCAHRCRAGKGRRQDAARRRVTLTSSSACRLTAPKPSVNNFLQ